MIAAEDRRQHCPGCWPGLSCARVTAEEPDRLWSGGRRAALVTLSVKDDTQHGGGTPATRKHRGGGERTCTSAAVHRPSHTARISRPGIVTLRPRLRGRAQGSPDLDLLAPPLDKLKLRNGRLPGFCLPPGGHQRVRLFPRLRRRPPPTPPPPPPPPPQTPPPTKRQGCRRMRLLDVLIEQADRQRDRAPHQLLTHRRHRSTLDDRGGGRCASC